MFFLIPFVNSCLSSVVILVSVTLLSIFFQLFPLLLDCLTFGFSYSPLLHLIDDQLSMLCWAILCDAIVMGSNKKKENYMVAITWKLYIWGSLFRDDFPCGYYLRVIISGQLFCGTDWVQIFFGTIIRRSNYQGGYCPGDNCSGGNGDQLSRGQLSPIVPLCGVWKYQKIIIWHHIIYHLTCFPKSQTRKILTSHFFSFFLFQKVKRGFQFFNMQPLKNILQNYVFWERFCGTKLFLNCGKRPW